jgi:hypothetical protein
MPTKTVQEAPHCWQMDSRKRTLMNWEEDWGKATRRSRQGENLSKKDCWKGSGPDWLFQTQLAMMVQRLRVRVIEWWR